MMEAVFFSSFFLRERGLSFASINQNLEISQFVLSTIASPAVPHILKVPCDRSFILKTTLAINIHIREQALLPTCLPTYLPTYLPTLVG